MTTMVKGLYTSHKMDETMSKAGYRYKVEGDWYTLDRFDPMDGMPVVDGNTHYFTNKPEADAYALAQVWVFNSDLHGFVEKI